LDFLLKQKADELGGSARQGQNDHCHDSGFFARATAVARRKYEGTIINLVAKFINSLLIRKSTFLIKNKIRKIPFCDLFLIQCMHNKMILFSYNVQM